MYKKTSFLFLILIIVTSIILIRLPTYQSTQNIVDNNITCNKSYGLSFPPFSQPEEIKFTLKELKELNINKIRIAIDWKNRELQKGEFYWKPMDDRIESAKKNNLSILLNVQSKGPNWACSNVKNEYSCVYNNEEEFKIFVTEILQRYNLDKIQFGNEWENQYVGSMEEFVKYNNILFDLTKEISPNTKVVLGGMTRESLIYELYCVQKKEPNFTEIKFKNNNVEKQVITKLNKVCNTNLEIKEKVLYVLENAKYDILDIHLYDDPSNWLEYVKLLPKDKPIIVSEFGGPNSEFEETNQDYQVKRLIEYLEAIENLPIEEAYYFKLVDSDNSYHKDSGLFDKNIKKKKAYEIFSTCTNSIPK